MAEAASKKCDPIKDNAMTGNVVTGAQCLLSVFVQDVKTYLILTLDISSRASPECWVLGLL